MGSNSGGLNKFWKAKIDQSESPVFQGMPVVRMRDIAFLMLSLALRDYTSKEKVTST